MLNGVQGMPPCRQSAHSNLREDPGILQSCICLRPDAMVEIWLLVSQTECASETIGCDILGPQARVERSVEIGEGLRGGGQFWSWQASLGWHLPTRPLVALDSTVYPVVQHFLVYSILAVLALHGSEQLVARSDGERTFRF